MKMRTFEVWDKATGSLVAGELELRLRRRVHVVERFFEDGVGGGGAMRGHGEIAGAERICLWDLGMELPYKTKLGAQLLPRDAFLKRLRQARPSARCGSTQSTSGSAAGC